MHDIVEALDSSGIPVIEVTHGDGLGGSSFNYGFSKTPEQELIRIAAETAKRARIAFLMLPGVGTKDDIRAAQDNGGEICRIATHCTEADTSIQHFGLARELGLETVGFLMMSHTQPPEVLAKQARIMVDAGCQCVYVVDSAGALIMEQTADRVSALVAEIGHEATVGFHGHENLGLGVANTVIAARAGATQIDGSVRRFGAGAGNTPLEAFIGVCDKLGWTTGVDFLQIVDASEDVIKPAMPEECQLDRMTLMMGYAGVYSSFLKHAGNAAERYGVSGAKILLEAGRRELIGGQEDQLIDIALMLKREAQLEEREPPAPEPAHVGASLTAVAGEACIEAQLDRRRFGAWQGVGMALPDPKDTLIEYLQTGRDAMVWKLDGLSEYDVRRPMTPTGTNLLGLVKHLASVELGYFGDTFGRPHGIDLPVAGRGRRRERATCTPPRTSPASTSSASTSGRGSTPPARSPRRTSTTPARCPGGGRGAVRSRSTRSWCTWPPRPTGTPATPTSCAR